MAAPTRIAVLAHIRAAKDMPRVIGRWIVRLIGHDNPRSGSVVVDAPAIDRRTPICSLYSKASNNGLATNCGGSQADVAHAIHLVPLKERMSKNLLSAESSPYLLQHQDNPVHWMPWGDEAFARAREEKKPILLSVGYAACHWCHVMAHESFENDEIAAVMNAHFVNIKVDREERPDVDTIYQQAIALLGEHGGWPLTMFLTDMGEPFWGGTYFPATPRYGRPGFGQVLEMVRKIYAESPDRVQSNVTALQQSLTQLSLSRPGETITMEHVDRTAQALLPRVDLHLGGMHGAPKFPNVPAFELIWRAYLRGGDAHFARAVLITLEKMSQGGIYDHLAGGYARYSTDPLWLAPHFEKMLYDNAQLIELLTQVWRRSHEPLFEARVRETVGWVLREMVAEGGGFAATIDADSEGEEGRFYVWTESEIEDALDDDATIFKKAYDVSAGGNWEGTNILNRLRVPKLDDPAEEARLAGMREILHQRRETRERPGWDDKVLADWNGMMIAALAKAADTFNESKWLEAARTAYQFVAETMISDGRLTHSYRLGTCRHAGMLDDYAQMARAALVLYEIDGEDRYLVDARNLVSTLDAHFWDSDGDGYFLTDDSVAHLITRTKSVGDNAVPAGNGVALEVLARLFLITGDVSYRNRADHILSAFAGYLEHQGSALATFLNAFELLSVSLQIVIVGPREGQDTNALRAVIRDSGLIAHVVTVIAPGAALPTEHPASGKGQVDNRATAYVCTGQTCSLPVTDPDALLRLLPSPDAAQQRSVSA